LLLDLAVEEFERTEDEEEEEDEEDEEELDARPPLGLLSTLIGAAAAATDEVEEDGAAGGRREPAAFLDEAELGPEIVELATIADEEEDEEDAFAIAVEEGSTAFVIIWGLAIARLRAASGRSE